MLTVQCRKALSLSLSLSLSGMEIKATLQETAHTTPVSQDLNIRPMSPPVVQSGSESH